MTPRCILFNGHQRCHRPAAKRMGDLYTCCSHGRIKLAVMSDWLSVSSRRMLSSTRWETAREGRRLLDRFLQRTAA